MVYCFYHANLLYMSRAILAHHKSGAISRWHGFLEDGETGVADCKGGGRTFIDEFMGVQGVFAFSNLNHLSQKSKCPLHGGWGGTKRGTVRRNTEEAV